MITHAQNFGENVGMIRALRTIAKVRLRRIANQIINFDVEIEDARTMLKITKKLFEKAYDTYESRHFDLLILTSDEMIAVLRQEHKELGDELDLAYQTMDKLQYHFRTHAASARSTFANSPTPARVEKGTKSNCPTPKPHRVADYNETKSTHSVLNLKSNTSDSATPSNIPKSNEPLTCASAPMADSVRLNDHEESARFLEASNETNVAALEGETANLQPEIITDTIPLTVEKSADEEYDSQNTRRDAQTIMHTSQHIRDNTETLGKSISNAHDRERETERALSNKSEVQQSSKNFSNAQTDLVRMTSIIITKAKPNDSLPHRTGEWIQQNAKTLILEPARLNKFIFRSNARVKLHCFGDANERIFDASIYAQTITADGIMTIDLTTVRARIATLDPQLVARLQELRSAILSARSRNEIENRIADYYLHSVTDKRISSKRDRQLSILPNSGSQEHVVRPATDKAFNNAKHQTASIKTAKPTLTFLHQFIRKSSKRRNLIFKLLAGYEVRSRSAEFKSRYDSTQSHKKLLNRGSQLRTGRSRARLSFRNFRKSHWPIEGRSILKLVARQRNTCRRAAPLRFKYKMSTMLTNIRTGTRPLLRSGFSHDILYVGASIQPFHIYIVPIHLLALPPEHFLTGDSLRAVTIIEIHSMTGNRLLFLRHTQRGDSIIGTGGGRGFTSGAARRIWHQREHTCGRVETAIVTQGDNTPPTSWRR